LFEKLPIFWAFGERRPEFRKFYKEMMALRRGSRALRRGTLEWIKNSDESRVVSFVRRAEGEEQLVTLNFSSTPFRGTVGPSTVSLAPWEFRIKNNTRADLGVPGRWPTAAKNGFGTSVTLNSKVWFTLANGVMTEVFYPTIDKPRIKRLQLHVHTSAGVEKELNDTRHEMKAPTPTSLTFQQVNKARSGQYTVTKTYITDPRRNSVLIDVNFEGRVPGHVSVHYEPTLSNNGNSALMSDCRADPQPRFRCTIAVGFAENAADATEVARRSLARGFEATRLEYEAGWSSYVARLPLVEYRYRRQFNMAAMVLRGLEDKTYRGAVIASPSVPWGGGADADEATISGYHAVWSRDLYHVATAFIALGDRETAKRLLDYLFRVQQKPDGSFPRNTWVDGRVIGDGLQMDQVALPLVLAWQLGRTDRVTWQKHVKPAADLIVQRGPRTEQDRWEEKSGYFPATVAAEIAGLVCAAEIARTNGDTALAKRYLNKADEWARNVELIDSSRVDAGFLELVRLGVKPGRDEAIIEALKVVDRTIKVMTPVGEAWYRYNDDKYGETPDGGDFDGRNGVGRLWTLLTGERGEYEIAAGDLAAARRRLETMARFTNDGMMIPEQVWDRKESPSSAFRFGEGTGSATPLAWSMAQFIRLAINLKHGRNLETPAVVVRRYLSQPQRGPKSTKDSAN
jgi:GH15 family glucan-1,4-alpha-glucosidase